PVQLEVVLPRHLPQERAVDQPRTVTRGGDELEEEVRPLVHLGRNDVHVGQDVDHWPTTGAGSRRSRPGAVGSRGRYHGASLRLSIRTPVRAAIANTASAIT